MYRRQFLWTNCCVDNTNPTIVRNRRVLELGCGTGFVAIAAVHADAKEVLATDGDDQVVDLAQFNINANGVASTCHAAKHLWGTDMDSLGDVDVVLGADIIACPYEGAYDDLLASLRHFVRGATVALIAYKRRHSSEVKFFHKLKRDFEWTTIPHDEYHEDFRHLDIDLLSIRAKSHGEA
ncbi:hypothetical protein LEN26_012223 [Aphanomyces euteiches]|nr:hypothetical protein LEN26_012223 [Aphanomyces euteiches]KAH9133336.1 hypothetical protein AeRB84_020471 [Aphanomyces euteiches]